MGLLTPIIPMSGTLKSSLTSTLQVNRLLLGPGFGTSFSISTGSYSSGCRIRLNQYDMNANLVGSSSMPMLSSVGNALIPVFSSYTGCGDLQVPSIFEPFSFSPQRWAMWYKNGIATGVQSYILPGPLTDSAVYEFKTKLICGDTLTTGPIPITRPSKPTVSVQGSTTICQGDTLIITAASGITIHNWTKDNVVIPGSSGLTSIKATQAGSYRVQGRYSSGGGTYCYLFSDPIVISVNPGAFITSPIYQVCNGDSVLLTCTPANSYVWKKNGNVIAGANSQTLWVKTSGQYRVLTTGLVCNTSLIKDITFFNNPTITVSPNGSVSLCSGAAATLTASGSNISSYQWYKNGTALAGGVLSTLTPTSSGKYKCTVANVIGCAKSSSNVTFTAQASSSTLPVKTLTLKPSSDGRDAYITTAFGSFGTNFGYTPSIEVSNWYKYFRTAERGFLDFDLSSIPANSPIISATLKLWVDTIDTKILGYPPNSLYFKRCIQPWQENTVTWNHQILANDYQASAIPCSTIQSKAYLSVNVANQLKHWSYVPGERFGFMMQFKEENHALSWASIASSDNPTASHHPKLTVKYYYADIIPNGPMNLCTGGNVTFSTNVGPYTYKWYKNGVAIAGANSNAYTATSAGTYFVMLTDAAGCAVSSIVRTVTMNAAPVVNLTPSGVINYCSGDTVVLSADSLPGYTFQWKKNNVNIAGATLRTYKVTQSGTFSVKVTSSCGPFSVDSVVCNKKFNPAATITANGPVTFCQGQTVTLTANTFNGVTYQWQKNGLNINYTTPSLTVGAAGSWAVLESANGCTRLSNTIVTTINCREGLEEARAIDVQVFPVPVTTESVIRLDGIDNFEEIMFDLYDISGKKWSSIPCTGEVTMLNDQNISNGIYLLRTMKGKEQLSVTKVVFAR
jgi:hypothetical protein